MKLGKAMISLSREFLEEARSFGRDISYAFKSDKAIAAERANRKASSVPSSTSNDGSAAVIATTASMSLGDSGPSDGGGGGGEDGGACAPEFR